VGLGAVARVRFNFEDFVQASNMPFFAGELCPKE
jgi:hypothetical protein